MEIISRQAARLHGLTRYFTGKPCAQGHTAERHVSSRNCVVCTVTKYRASIRRDPRANRARATRWAKANQSKVVARVAQWRADNPERHAEHDARYRLRKKGKPVPLAIHV